MRSRHEFARSTRTPTAAARPSEGLRSSTMTHIPYVLRRHVPRQGKRCVGSPQRSSPSRRTALMLPNMTRICGCLVAVLVVAWFAPAGSAAAAGLPVGRAKGVSVQVGSHGVNFRFARKLDLTVAALLRPGRRIELSCTRLG